MKTKPVHYLENNGIHHEKSARPTERKTTVTCKTIIDHDIAKSYKEDNMTTVLLIICTCKKTNYTE